MATRKIKDEVRDAMAGLVLAHCRNAVKHIPSIDRIARSAAEFKRWHKMQTRIDHVENLTYFNGIMRAAVEYCENNIKDLENYFKNPPTFDSVKAELVALEAQFPKKVRYYPRSKMIKVRTDAISLTNADGVTVELGCFDMVLKLQHKLPIDKIVKAVAVKPNFAYHTSIPHPHVRGTHICMGDGKEALGCSVKQGRMSDFYEILNNLLHTYSEGSAYVELHDWRHPTTQCVGCGCDSEETARCVHCRSHFCGECCLWCGVCDQAVCSDCDYYCSCCDHVVCGNCMMAAECQCCHEGFCINCREACRKCGYNVCSRCINEAGICKICQTALTNTETPAPTPESTVQAARTIVLDESTPMLRAAAIEFYAQGLGEAHTPVAAIDIAAVTAAVDSAISTADMTALAGFVSTPTVRSNPFVEAWREVLSATNPEVPVAYSSVSGEAANAVTVDDSWEQPSSNF